MDQREWRSRYVAYIAAKNPDLVLLSCWAMGATREMVEAARVMGFLEDKIEQSSDVNEAPYRARTSTEAEFFPPRHLGLPSFWIFL